MTGTTDGIGKQTLQLLEQDRSAQALLYLWHRLKHDHELQASATRRLPEIRGILLDESEYYLGKFREPLHPRMLLKHNAALEPAEKLLALLVALDTLRAPEEEGALKGYGATSIANTTLHNLHGDKEKRYYVALRRDHYPALSRNARNVDSLLAWHPNHTFIPEKYENWRIELKRLSRSAEDRLSALALSGQALRVCVADFNDGVQLAPPLGRSAYFAAGLEREERRKQAIFEALAAARTNRVHVLVLPELAVTPALRNAVSIWLDENEHPFLLVAPGSFHQLDEGDKRNVAHLMDFMGVSTLVHRKLTRYGETDGVFEDIIPGTTIEILDTPFGLLAVPICKDAFDENRMKKGAVWTDLGCDLLLAPSMSNAAGMSAHTKEAQSQERGLSGLVAVANHWDWEDKDIHCSLVHSPRIIEASRVEGGANCIAICWPTFSFPVDE